MNVSFLKGAALCGLSLMLAGIGGAASAQTYHHGQTYHHTPYHAHRAHERAAIMRQKAKYARAVSHGHPGAAERAHLRASEIRHHIRTQRTMHMDHHR